MSLYLIRHTAVAVPAGVCYGRADVPLAAGFSEAAHAVRARLPFVPRRLVTSPATRCCRLAETFGAGPIVDLRLQELDFGAWELRRWDDLPRTEIDRWSEDFVDRAPPGGETFADLALRAEAAVAAYADGEPTLVVTHAGVIRALLAPRRGLALRDAFTLPVEFGGLYELSHTP